MESCKSSPPILGFLTQVSTQEMYQERSRAYWGGGYLGHLVVFQFPTA